MGRNSGENSCLISYFFTTFAAQIETMRGDFAQIMFYSVNLVFIVTNIYGWLLKRFYVPNAYKQNFHELFPAQRFVANFYLLQLIEIPYLLMVGRPEALFYVNGASLLLFSSFILVMVRGYFFLQTLNSGRLLLFLLPMWLCWLALLLPMFGALPFTTHYQWIMTGIIFLFFFGYMYHLDKARREVMQRIRMLDEGEYSNEEDFPVKFARSIKWLPLILCVLLAVNFIVNDPMVKMLRDVVFTIINVWFAIYTLNPHREIKSLPIELKQKEEEEETDDPKRHLNEEQRQEMESRLLALVREEKLYLNDHLSMNDLIKRLHTNKTYLSEVIAKSEYGSFYQLINTLRIEHACWMLGEDPNLKMEQVALSSGFSSGSAFSQVFKRIKGMSPTEYLHK